jgi:hypothetical protein
VVAIVALISSAEETGVVIALLLAVATPLAMRFISRRFAAGGATPGHDLDREEPGDFQVTPHPDIAARLTPRTSEGRRSAEHVLSIENRGGGPFDATVAASDREGFLAFEVQPATLSAPAGGSAVAAIRVRPRKRIFLSGAKPRPFQLLVSPPGAAPFAIDGTMIQERFIPLWLMPFTGLALLLIALAVLLVLLVIGILVYVRVVNGN